MNDVDFVRRTALLQPPQWIDRGVFRQREPKPLRSVLRPQFLATLRTPPPPGLYWRAVREIVAKEDALRAIRGLGPYRGWKNGRGVIGAAAAAAWRPRDRTYEVIAYREPSRWGTPREIQENPAVIEAYLGAEERA